MIRLPSVRDLPPLRRLAVVSAAALLLGLSIGTLFAMEAASSPSSPAITLLGSGDEISVLVTGGRSRLLIATGSDNAEFGNALGEALPLNLRRIDVLILAGSSSDTTFLSRALRISAARHVEVVGKDDLLGDLGLEPDNLLATPRRFQLPDDVTVTIESVNIEGHHDGPALAWRAMIDHGATRVVLLSDGRVAAVFPDPGQVAALIVGGANAIDVIGQVDARSLFVSGSAVSGKALRGVGPIWPRRLGWSLRVHPGEIYRLEFTPQGLHLPDAVIAAATPAVV